MPLNVGSSAISKLYVGSSAVDKLYLGSNEVWSNFTPMGMDKSGNLTLRGSDLRITGWTPRAGFPGTFIDSSALSVSGSAQVRVKAAVAISGGYFPTFKIMHNGTQIVTRDSPGTFADTTITLTSSSLLYMTVTNPFSDIVINASGTYLYFELVA